MTDTPTPVRKALKLGGTFLKTFDLEMKNPETGELTGWVITLAGPGHPQSQALFDRQAQKANKKSAAIELAQVNGRKWKGEDARPTADVRRETVSNIVARVVGWSPAIVELQDGEEVEFSPDAAVELFLNPDNGGYLKQIVDYFDSEKAFLKVSANS